MHVMEQIASLGFKRVIPKNNFEQKKQAKENQHNYWPVCVSVHIAASSQISRRKKRQY